MRCRLNPKEVTQPVYETKVVQSYPLHHLALLCNSSSMPPPPWVRGARAPHPYAAEDPSSQGDDGNAEAGPSTVPTVSTLERPRECINKHSTPPFSLLCTMMDRLRTEEANKRRDTLARFMNLWRIKVGNDLYPLIRLLLPDVSLCGRRRLTGSWIIGGGVRADR